MEKLKNIIKIVIGIEAIFLLGMLSILMLQEMELKEIAIYTWQEKVDFKYGH